MTDAQIIEWLHANMQWDGHGYWLPDICLRERGWGQEHCAAPTIAEFRAELLRKMKKEQKP